MADSEGDQGFLSRWSRRKTQARLAAEGLETPLSNGALAATGAPGSNPPPAPAPQTAPLEAAPSSSTAEILAAANAEAPAPCLADVERLTPESDFTRFVARGVHTEVKNAALKKLFSDPHFNLMDGLDVYIDDYSVADPLPSSMLRQMAQARFVGFLSPDAHEVAPVRADSDTPPADGTAAHENADLQLQPDDDAGRPCAAPGAGRDTGREH